MRTRRTISGQFVRTHTEPRTDVKIPFKTRVLKRIDAEADRRGIPRTQLLDEIHTAAASFFNEIAADTSV